MIVWLKICYFCDSAIVLNLKCQCCSSVDCSHSDRITSECCLCAWQKLTDHTAFRVCPWRFVVIMEEVSGISGLILFTRFTSFQRITAGMFPTDSHTSWGNIPPENKTAWSFTWEWARPHSDTHTRVKSQASVTHRFRACCIHRNVVSQSIKFLP